MGRRAKPDCPVETTLELLSGKWKANILFHLLSGTKRSGELRRLMPAVTQQMLTAHLRELERDGIIHRRFMPRCRPRSSILSLPWAGAWGRSSTRSTNGA